MHSCPRTLLFITVTSFSAATAASPTSALAPMEARTQQTLNVLETLKVELERQLGDFISLSTTLRHRQHPALPYNIAVDEAIIRLGHPALPLSLTAGKTAVPFTLLDSQPWQATAHPTYDSRSDNVLQLNGTLGVLEGDLYLFKGDGDSTATQHTGGLNLRYRPQQRITLEASYLNNLSNTDLLTEREQVPALRLGAHFNARTLQLSGEHLQTDAIMARNQQRPTLSHVNLNYALDSLFGAPTTLGVTHAVHHGVDFLELNQQQSTLSIQRQLNPETQLQLEFERSQPQAQTPSNSLSIRLETHF